MRILGLLLGLAVICSNANAAIIMTIGNVTSAIGSGTISVDVFARTTTSDSVLTFVSDFDVQDGKFGAIAGVFGVDSSYIGGAGFNGQGASNIGAASSFTGNNKTGLLSIEFTVGQPFLATDAKIATLLIDKTGVGAGTYTITASNMDALSPQGASIPVTSNIGSFTITAVPEPTSIALLAVAMGGVFGRRVLRARKKLVSIA